MFYISLIFILFFCFFAFYFYYQKLTNSFFIAGSFRFFCFFLFLILNFALVFFSYNFLVSDFSLLNVLSNSYTIQPVLYKLCNIWGSHEGSLLLLCWVLTVFMLFFCNVSRLETLNLFSKIIFVQFCVLFFFLLLLFISNPFIEVEFITDEGDGLNPILQDVGMSIHPPLLYMGYMGSIMPFSLAVVVLLTKNITYSWLKTMRFFVLLNWIILTVGIFLGSWWAYYELGWGGWWFWDPVENISLMPWLLNTALLHTISLVYKRGNLINWVIGLSLFSFLLTLIGIFVVRSGLLVSVHSFSIDYAKLFLFSIFIIILIVLYLYFFLTRLNFFVNQKFVYLKNNEFLIIWNNLFFVISCFVVFLGTFLPNIFSFFFNKNISLGPIFFLNSLSPILFCSLILLLCLPLWFQVKNGNKIFNIFLFFGFMSIIICYFLNNESLILNVFIQLSVFILFSFFWYVTRKSKNYVFLFSHIGFVLLILGFSLSKLGSFEFVINLNIGDKLNVFDWEFVLRGIFLEKGPNYVSVCADLVVKNVLTNICNIFIPEKRFFLEDIVMLSKMEILSTYISDLLVILNEGDLHNGWPIRIYYIPGVNLIWFSVIIIIFGSILNFYKYLKSIYF